MQENQIQKLHEQALHAAKVFQSSEAELLHVSNEIDHRKAYLALGLPSLFRYALSLGLTESQSYAFMSVARKSREIPELKEKIESGALSVSKAVRIVPVIENASAKAWVSRAVNLSKRELEKEVAREKSLIVPQREILRTLSPTESRVHLNLSEETVQAFKRTQELLVQDLGEAVGSEATIAKALEFFFKHKDPVVKAKRVLQKIKGAGGVSEPITRREGMAATHEDKEAQIDRSLIRETPPGQSSQRGIPAILHHQVHHRDQGRCQFPLLQNDKGDSGRLRVREDALRRRSGGFKSDSILFQKDRQICASSFDTEVHHRIPLSKGGRYEVNNLVTLCRAHHQWEHRSGEVGSRLDV